MQFPESWLREFCDPPLTTAQLAETLTMGGLEVESLRLAAPPFHGVVVGAVLEVAQHPNADRLRVCTVDAGTGAPLQIVCGAPNVRAGIKVPCALAGAELPPASEGGAPLRIELGTIRGVESRGMLCSARELALADDHAGLLVLDEGATIGADLRRQLDLDDTIFTLKLTPNLGHALSVLGVACELAALTGAPLREPSFPAQPVDDATRLPVTIEASDLCGRFSGRVIKGVDPRALTPRWMVDRLARCGQRSVTPLVDISNYVMFELGRPTHIFDLDKIEGGLAVRWGRAGESLELLDGRTIELDGEVGVIADAAGVESLAGIMGGQASAVGDDTRNVFVEAAFWWPQAIAGRPRRFQLSTDAGHRFERGVDPATTVPHLERISALVVAICGGPATVCGPIDDHVVALPERHPVTLRIDRAARVIGMPVTQADCEAAMQRLGLPFTSRPGAIEVVPPSARFDLEREEDLIEEVIRIIGYERLPATPARGRLAAHVGSEARRSAATLRGRLAARGWLETIAFSFVAERSERELAGNADPIRVLNPIAADLSVMRSSLLGSLVEVVRVNVSRKVTRGKVFELGKVYRRAAAVAGGPFAVPGVEQPLRLGGIAFGAAAPLQWAQAERPVDFFDVKGDLEALAGAGALRFVAALHPALHPGRSAAIERAGVRIGFIGELHPRWKQSYGVTGNAVLFELDAEAVAAVAVPVFVPLPRQQPVWRDVALVDGRSLAHYAFVEAARRMGGPLVRSATVYDIFQPKLAMPGLEPGERSLTLRLELRDDESTLTDERIEATVAAVITGMQRELGVRLRAGQAA